MKFFTKYIFILSIPIFAFTLGCDQITPKFKFRDNYTGKKCFRPNKITEDVKRDNIGNPLITNEK